MKKSFFPIEVQMQEQTYYEKLLALLDKKLTSSEKRRLKSELTIIKKMHACKKLYVFYTAIQKIKKDKQYYRLYGGSSNTLIFSLLGISKTSPYDKTFPYVLPYETAIGTLAEPRFLDCTVAVAESYIDSLARYLKKTFGKDSDFYQRINLTGGVFQYDPMHIITLPKKSDPYSYGDYLEAYGMKGFLSCFRQTDAPVDLSVIGIEDGKIPQKQLLKNDFGDPVFLKAYNDFLDALQYGEKNSTGYLLDEKYAKINKKKIGKYKNDFWNFCCDINKQFNGKNKDRHLIRCREDLWNVIDRTKLQKKEKYSMYKAAYFGRELTDHMIQSIKETYVENYETILKEIRDSELIWPIVHTIELARSDIESFSEKRFANDLLITIEKDS